MNSILHFALAAFALLTSAVLMAHLKSKASSGLLHHATHGRLFKARWLNRWCGELTGIVTLSIGFILYRKVHGKHHGFPTFAQPGADEEADDLIREGFEPGRSRQLLWRTFWQKPFSPAWHTRMAAGRLRANFFGGANARTVVAWVLWGGGASLAWAAGWLPGWLGAMLLMLMAGSVASYLELVSRHLWGITPPSTGRERQLALSRWRLPSPAVPSRWTLASTVRFLGEVALKALWRFCVTPLDLPHHPAHHLAWDAAPGTGERAWADAALAYSDRLRAEPQLHAYMHGSLLDAVDEWFRALEKASPLAAARRR